MHTAVVVPTSNDASTIVTLLSSLHACLEVTAVFVVDAGSTDGTLARVAEFRDTNWSRVHVVALREESSWQTSLRVGFELATQVDADRIVQLSALTVAPAHVLASLAAAVERGSDVAIASPTSLLDIATLYELSGSFATAMWNGPLVGRLLGGNDLQPTDAFQAELITAAMRLGALVRTVPVDSAPTAAVERLRALHRRERLSRMACGPRATTPMLQDTLF